jgi:mRNA-degrading endonuclease RelE of RelBE toxin-antitoxin system
LDIKPLKGLISVYRCRIGDYRVVFKKSFPENEIIALGGRGDVYK